MVRNSLAHALGALRRYEEALKHSTRALEIYREIRDSDGEVTALITLAHNHCDAGRAEKAMEYAQNALVVADHNHRRRSLATILHTMGRIELALGEVAGSVKRYEGQLLATLARIGGGDGDKVVSEGGS